MPIYIREGIEHYWNGLMCNEQNVGVDWTGLLRQHCRLTICIELVELTNSVSDDKIQITLLRCLVQLIYSFV